MHIRMLPLSFAFNRLPRLVHDMSQKLEKKVELIIHGEQTEIDKTVIDRLIDPLLHLVRNSLDHGIEPPAARIAAGKPETGRIELKAYQKGGNVVIEIRDDGRGLVYDRIFSKAVERGLIPASANPAPEEIAEMIFRPGFSTADAVSDVSGRGVGMDVVRNNIRSLGGTVEVASQPGRGACFTVRLPLTLAILDGLSVQVGAHTYILPLVSIVESVRINPEQISRPAGGAELYGLRKEFMPLLRLYELFHVEPRSTDLAQGLLVIVEADGKKAGLYVDDLLGQQQVVIKSLATHYRKVEGISAATILGDGTVAMILDVTGLIRLVHAGAGRGPVPAGDTFTSTVTPTLN
jgi:two-component system chemotaxis sensor kinase CheA